MIKVSIVIVCMNNLKNLYPCLDSIKKYTSVSYETLVVAYLFSKENLKKLRKDYPWIIVIESKEIRGFSENNNLALRQAKGEYCFVVNDDTEMKMSVVDRLVSDFDKVSPEVAVISPKTVFGDGRLQSCGRPKMTTFDYVKGTFGLWKEFGSKSEYTNKEGLFQSYTLVGAAFLIKRDVFEKMGLFDEKFFFCPEDVALGNLLNERRYKCYVDADVVLHHYEGQTAKRTMLATSPSGMKGSLIYYSKNSTSRYLLLSILVQMGCVLRVVYHFGKSLSGSQREKLLYKANVNCIKAIFMPKTPKEIFIHFYTKLKVRPT
jgi:Predicted glycosyltransferases